MNIPKYKHKVLLLMCVAVVVFGVVALAGAYTRPAAPIMDYVPQNLGIYDTYYQNFKESDCRVCHGASTAERHHGSQYALEGNCLFCHSAIPGVVPPERDCKVCHVSGGAVGDFPWPHHNSDAADSDQCTQCHSQNLLVETNTVPAPGYEPTSVTPSPYSCENCHWSSGKASAHHAPAQADWETWIGWPVPTYFPDGTPDPQPIEANGPVFSGDLWAGGKTAEVLGDADGDEDGICDAGENCVFMPKKNYAPLDGTHHEVQGKVYDKCTNCHGTNPDTDPDWEPTNAYLIRSCENCHSVGTLHAIKEHVTTGNIYSQAWALNTKVKANQKCVACHGDYLAQLPPQPAVVAEIDYIEPNFGSPGIVVDIHTKPGFSFGTKALGDWVKMCQGSFCTDVPIYSWAENQIQIKVPGQTFSPGNAKIKIHKATGTTSPVVFTIRKHPAIYKLTPSIVGYGDQVDIHGTGFYVAQEDVYFGATNSYGYSTYVKFIASNDTYMATEYPGTWSNTDISIKVENLLDLNTMTPVPQQSLYVGGWNTVVVTDYFKVTPESTGTATATGGSKDVTGTGTSWLTTVKVGDTFQIVGDANKYKVAQVVTDTYIVLDTWYVGVPPSTNYNIAGYNHGLNGLNPDAELLYRETSDPATMQFTTDPYINAVSPNPVPGGNTLAIRGGNFGSNVGQEVIGDGKGDDDGICEPNEFCRITICNKNKTVCTAPIKGIKTYAWTNTEIKIKAPGNTSLLPKLKWVKVNPKGKPVSNYYQFTVIHK